MLQGWAEQLNQTSARARLGAENWMTNLQANSKNIKMPKFGMPGAAACACLPNTASGSCVEQLCRPTSYMPTLSVAHDRQGWTWLCSERGGGRAATHGEHRAGGRVWYLPIAAAASAGQRTHSVCPIKSQVAAKLRA